MSVKKMLVILGTLIVAAAVFTACGGSPTTVPEVPETPVMAETQAAPTEAPVQEASAHEVSLQPETCGVCHPDAGEKRRDQISELYQDGVIKVEAVNYNSPNRVQLL